MPVCFGSYLVNGLILSLDSIVHQLVFQSDEISKQLHDIISHFISHRDEVNSFEYKKDIVLVWFLSNPV